MPDSQPSPEPEYKDGEFGYKKGNWWPLWSLLLLPFLIIFIPFYRSSRKDVNWIAAWLTVLIFEVCLVAAEWYSLSRGHCVYNQARIWGPTVWGIPIEEPLLYYLFPPLFVICLLHFVKSKVEGKK